MIQSLEIVFLFLSYLIGSIPFGYIIVKFATGKNIMEYGSGNIGSTNVKRIAGKKLSVITQLLDMLKGLLPIAVFLLTEYNPSIQYYIYMLALMSILGHNFSVFLKFKGGKGVNTTLGASVLIVPYSVFIAVGVYYIVKWKFKYVSLGSLMLGITMPLVELLIHGLSLTFYYLLVCTILIILLHRANIFRIIKKQELSS
jgi:glycerol-3-phosphate acyltransferase PlsY